MPPKVIFKAYRFWRTILSPKKRYLLTAVEECFDLREYTPYIFDTKTKQIECCPLQSDIDDQWSGGYIPLNNFDFADFSLDEKKLAISEFDLVWLYCFEKREWSTHDLLVDIVKFIDDNRMICISCQRLKIFNCLNFEVECEIELDDIYFHHCHMVMEHQALTCFSKYFIPESMPNPPDNTKNKVFFYLIWIKPTIEKQKLQISLVGWFNDTNINDCKENQYGVLTIKEGEKYTVVKILDVARSYIEAREKNKNESSPNYGALIYDSIEIRRHEEMPLEVFGSPTKFNISDYATRFNLSIRRFMGQVDRDIFYINLHPDSDGEFDVERLEFINCKNWKYWMFAGVIAPGLAEDSAQNPWPQFLKKNLYDPRLLVLIWAFAE